MKTILCAQGVGSLLCISWVCLKTCFHCTFCPDCSFLPAGEGLLDPGLDPGMTRSGSKLLFLSVTERIIYSGTVSSCCCLVRVFLCSSSYEHSLCLCSSN